MAVSGRVAMLIGFGARSTPADAHQMSPCPSLAVPAALQSTTTWTSNVANAAQLTTVAIDGEVEDCGDDREAVPDLVVPERTRPRIGAPQHQHRDPDGVGEAAADEHRQLAAGHVSGERRRHGD